jgi:hypothetical protein
MTYTEVGDRGTGSEGVRLGPIPFIIDALGVFDEAHLGIVWCDESQAATPELDRLVEVVWRRQLKASRRAGVHLFNGRLVRYLRHTQENGTLRVEVGATDYARFMGTNYLNWHRGDEFGWERFSNPLGTSANIITSDGWLVLGRRNEKVACHAGYVHSLGGSIEAAERRADGTFDAFASMRRELAEEAKIVNDEIEELICLGLIRDPHVRQPELIFNATVRMTREEVAGRIQSADDEHVGVEACRDLPEAIETFIRTTPRVAAVAAGGLCLHGRRMWGGAWFDQTVRRLPPPIPPQISQFENRTGLSS